MKHVWRNGKRLFKGYGRTEQNGKLHNIALYGVTTLRDTTTHYPQKNAILTQFKIPESTEIPEDTRSE